MVLKAFTKPTMFHIPVIRRLPRFCYSPVLAPRLMSSLSLLHTPTPVDEDALYDAQVRDVSEWWTQPRWQGIKRPYTPEDVISKRGTLPQTYPSSHQARKLWSLLQEKGKKGEPVHTSEHHGSSALLRGKLADRRDAGGLKWERLIPCR